MGSLCVLDGVIAVGDVVEHVRECGSLRRRRRSGKQYCRVLLFGRPQPTVSITSSFKSVNKSEQ